MFRAQSNPFDDVVAKATDENLTSENWEYMLDCWESVNSSPSPTAAADVVRALITRLSHRNANVQLYTLSLAHALSQNCGPKLHQELASRAFTDALLRLANDRNTHQKVKASVLEKMGEWKDMFKGDPGLGIMEEAWGKLRREQPGLTEPERPGKREITDADRAREEEELQMALAISLGDRGPSAAASSSAAAQGKQQPQPQQQQQQPAPQPPHTTAATVSRVRALYDFVPSEAGELAFRKGDVIAVLESVYKDWWKGSLRGQTGIFPLNYVEKLSDPTPEELQRDAQMEAEVFGQIKNVEKLLALLSTNEGGAGAGADNEEITSLYHSTLAIRPKLIELIGKYSQKKDDFVALNEKFIKARRDYEALLEASMAHGGSSYPRPANPYSYPPPPGPDHSYYPPTSNPSASPPPQNQPYTAPAAPSNPPYAGRQPSNQYYPSAPSEPPADHQPPHQQPPGSPFYVVGQRPPSRAPSGSYSEYVPGGPSQSPNPPAPQELAAGHEPARATSPYQAYQPSPVSPQIGPSYPNLGGAQGQAQRPQDYYRSS